MRYLSPGKQAKIQASRLFTWNPGRLEAAEPFDCTQNNVTSHFSEEILDLN